MCKQRQVAAIQFVAEFLDFFSEEAVLALVHTQACGKHPKQRCFARAVCPEYRQYLVVVYVKIKPVQYVGRGALVAKITALNTQHNVFVTVALLASL